MEARAAGDTVIIQQPTDKEKSCVHHFPYQYLCSKTILILPQYFENPDNLNIFKQAQIQIYPTVQISCGSSLHHYTLLPLHTVH